MLRTDQWAKLRAASAALSNLIPEDFGDGIPMGVLFEYFEGLNTTKKARVREALFIVKGTQMLTEGLSSLSPVEKLLQILEDSYSGRIADAAVDEVVSETLALCADMAWWWGHVGRMVSAPHTATYEPHTDNGDLMTVIDWVNMVEEGGFVDDDGYGVFATQDLMTDIKVRPSDVVGGHLPNWEDHAFTHVMWYNK